MKNLRRLSYYTRKVVAFGRVPRYLKRNQYRSQRLLNYKKALNERLREELSNGKRDY